MGLTGVGSASDGSDDVCSDHADDDVDNDNDDVNRLRQCWRSATWG